MELYNLNMSQHGQLVQVKKIIKLNILVPLIPRATTRMFNKLRNRHRHISPVKQFVS